MENINMNNISITSTLQQQHQHQQPQANAMTESTLNNSNRKLYFKQSATEALHSAILLKARNPSVSQQQILQQQQQQQQLQQQQSIIKSCDTGSNNRILLLNAKWPNQINNLATISSSNSCNANSTMPPVINLTDENQSQQITSSHITVAPIAIDSAGSMVGNANYSDELDSPFKIKENILTSIRNLKPVLAGLSSSTSDEDEDELNNNNNNNSNNNNVNIISNSVNEIQEINYQPNDIILYSSSSPSMPSSSSSILPNVVNNSNGIVKLTIATNNLIPRHNYLRTNTTTYAKLNTPTNANSIGNNNPTSTTPKLPSAFNEMKLSFNNNNSTQLQSLQQQQIQSITVTPPIILNKTTSSTTNSSSSLLLTKTQLNRITSVSSKRGKDEALSNSSSSDEETEHQHRNQQQQQQRVNNTNQSNNQKLQLILNNGNSLKSLMSNKQTNLLTITQQQQQPSQSQQQPYITPVVSAASVAAAAAAAASSSTAHQSSINYTTESDLINSPSSMSSNKSESDYGSLINSNLSFSISSPTSCCSSSNSSSCTTNDSSSAIDLNDDNSSTASGPIYVRQPGFEFHAHEVQQQQQQQQQQMLVAQTSEQQQQQQQPTKPLLKSLNRSNKKQDDSTTVCGSKSSNTQKNTKAKKKLCMMLIADPMSSKEETKANSIQLKPISNKAKRDPLPMRLRALPPSFWQQPNQPSASLTSTMYLPPLFKNDIIESVLDSAESSTNANCYYDEDYSGTTGTGKIGMFDSCQTNYREVRISPANTDLLFKLFDNIEQKDSKKQMQLQFKSHR
jgi:hypothetical protein